jgi:phospholipid/cholesterol/gamma-HCH transport system permease protein
MVKILEFIGAGVIAFVNELGRVMLMLWESILWLLKRPFRWEQIFQQLEFIGVQSTSIILLTGGFAGAVMALQSSYAFSLSDANSMVGTAVALAITRELGPVMTALTVSGRCGSAMAAEIGTMRVTEQIDALTVMAVNPIQFLVVPRLIAAIIMIPALTIVFDFIGVFGAGVVSNYLLDVSPEVFMNSVLDYVDMEDFGNGVLKSVFFGLIVALISCYKGFNASRGAKGVGEATTASVVTSSVAVLISDYFLTALLFTK